MIDRMKFRLKPSGKIQVDCQLIIGEERVRIRADVPNAQATPAAKKAINKGRDPSPNSATYRWAMARVEREIQKREKKTTKPEKKARKEPKPDKGMTLKSFVDLHLESYWTQIQAKPATRARHVCVLNAHHLPVLGDVPLAGITRGFLAAHQAKVAKKMRGRFGGDPKPSSVNMSMVVLMTMLRYAAELELIENAPMLKRMKSKPLKRAKRYSDEELAQFLLAAANTGDPHVLLAALLGADQGMRCSEIVTLEREDIDFKRMEITIKRGLSLNQPGSTKGGNVRTIPMTMRVAQAVRSAPASVVVPQVVWRIGRKGQERYTARRLYDAFLVAQSAAGLKLVGTHILRHTCASRLADRGASQAQIACYLGQVKASTADIYTHVSADGVRGLLDRELGKNLAKFPMGLENR